MVILRVAKPSDWARLYVWRNEEAARQASVRVDPIPLEEHLAWFARLLTATHPGVFVGEDTARGRTVGVVRCDTADEAEPGAKKKAKGRRVGVVSITVDDRYRAEGYGAQMLARIGEQAAEQGYAALLAVVKLTNGHSLRLFAAAGYTVARVEPDLVHLVKELR